MVENWVNIRVVDREGKNQVGAVVGKDLLRVMESVGSWCFVGNEEEEHYTEIGEEQEWVEDDIADLLKDSGNDSRMDPSEIEKVHK